MSARTTSPLRRQLISGLLLAATGVVICAVIALPRLELLWRAYLFAYLSCWLVTMGGIGLLALGNLTGGRWAAAARPFYLANLQTLPFVLLSSIPIALGLAHIYPWAITDSAARQALSSGKATYLSSDFFLIRAAVYFTIWISCAWLLQRASRIESPPGSTLAMRRAGAVSLVLLVPTSTFAAFDWGMSLEPAWYSSIYGAILTAAGVVAAHALAILALASVAARNETIVLPSEEAVGAHEVPLTDVLSDLGNLLLAFVMLWAYFSFSQFLIIWSGDLPNEITWYEHRIHGSWGAVALAVVVLQFAAPFVMLLSREGKRSSRHLARVAIVLLVACVASLYWTIVPAFSPADTSFFVLNFAAFAGLGGLWFALFCRQSIQVLASGALRR
jgi:hypothetical protein